MTVGADSRDINQILDEIESAISKDNRRLALQLAVSALERGSNDPLVLVLAAEQYEEDGQSQHAVVLLKKATLIAPEEAEVWRRLGSSLARRGSSVDALSALNTALAIEPGSYPTLVAAGATAFALADLKSAEQHYRRALELKPNDPELLATLAVIVARRDDEKGARALAERALVLRPDLITAQMAIGRADLLSNQAELTVDRMTRLLDRSDLSEDNRIGALDLRADALDKLENAAGAFADYAARNTILERITAPMIQREVKERRINQVSRLIAHFSQVSADPWRISAGEDLQGARCVKQHVFLLGFPRSGTTLLEKVLASHPDIVTMEEVDHLRTAGGHFLDSDAALSGLASMPRAAASVCREIYWSGVRKTLGNDINGRTLVDKLPLHTPNLPLIAKLFPQAKILFALRDPRDVVLSCFRRRFKMNSAMYELLTLDGAADYYIKIMTLADIYRDVLPLDVLEVRHERMVANFEGEVREVLAFLAANWDPSVHGFADRARAMTRTPSDPQVARGLNSDGVGQWRRYERQLEPVLVSLEPWVRRFGYRAGVNT